MATVEAQPKAEREDIKNHLVKGKRARTPSAHVVNQVHHDEATRGELLADRIASGIGSWTFLIVQSFLVLVWVAANLIGWRLRWDPYPFILLNLMFSVQAAYTGPVLLLAGNRQAQKDRLTLEHAAYEAERSEETTRRILSEIQRNTELTVEILDRMQKQRQELVDRLGLTAKE